MNGGATPKHRKSVRLSNSAPNRDVALSSRASRPSMPSIAAATATETTAAPNRPSNANRMPVSPAHRPSMVSKLGSIRLNDGPLKRGRLRGRSRRRSLRIRFSANASRRGVSCRRPG